MDLIEPFLYEWTSKYRYIMIAGGRENRNNRYVQIGWNYEGCLKLYIAQIAS